MTEEPLDPETLNILVRRGLALLRFGDPRVLEDKRHRQTRFSLTFDHHSAHAGRAGSLVLIQFRIDDAAEAERAGREAEHLAIGVVKSVAPVSTFVSRVVFDDVRRVAPETLQELLDSIRQPNMVHHAGRLAQSEKDYETISETLGKVIVQALSRHSENRLALRYLAGRLDRPQRFVDARSLQVDAIRLAMRAFGASDATRIQIDAGDSMLSTVRLHEDTVIEHDARAIPGWSMTDSDYTGRALFIQGDAVLEVYTANRRPLEQLFGVDLVYLNRRQNSFVMVQYKMMEPVSAPRAVTPGARAERTDDCIVPIDKQFEEEIARMWRFTKDLSPAGKYRLNPCPFYLKLVRRNADSGSAGIVLSLDHFDALFAGGHLDGQRGGLRISYSSLSGHYLRSEAFVDLIRSGYIGSREATTAHLQRLMLAALDGGRSVVAAIETAW